MSSLRDKVILITGAARGQGAAHARRCAADGATVVVTDVLDELGNAVAEDIGDGAVYLSLDVASEVAWTRTIEAVIARFGRVDGLVNNAGVVTVAPLLETSTAEFRRTIDVNQLGVFLGIRTTAPHMPRGGSIVNVSSIDGLIGMPGIVAYAATKFAVRGMTKVAAIELAARGVRVNSIHPGVIDTVMLEGADAQAALPSVIAGIPLGRVAEPDEVSASVVFLLGEASGYITGSEVVVDGGLTAGKHFHAELTS